MGRYCGFCGLEYLQLCFCHRDEFRENVRRLDLEEAANYRIKYYQKVLRTLQSEDRYLAHEPGYSIYKEAYQDWING